MKKENKYLRMLKSFFSSIWYVVALVAVCTTVIILIVNGKETMDFIGKLISILMPFIIGFFFAYLINPFVKLLTKQLDRISPGKLYRAKRAVGLFFSYLIILSIITVVIVYIFPQIKESSKELGNSLRNGYDYVTTHQKEINSWLPFVEVKKITDYVKNDLLKNIMNNGTNIFPVVYNFSFSIVSIVYDVFMGLVISVYIVWDSQSLVKTLKKVVYAFAPKDKAEGVWKTMLECNHIFNGFLFGKAIDSLIIGVLCFIAMSILQLPYSLLLSVIVCITNMIPYFGPFIGAVPGVLIYLFMDPKQALIFAIMILVLQQFDGLYLGPKILGDLTGIKPLWVIFGITLGGAYFGVLGMFLGVPTVAVLVYLSGIFFERKMKKKKQKLKSADSE